MELIWAALARSVMDSSEGPSALGIGLNGLEIGSGVTSARLQMLIHVDCDNDFPRMVSVNVTVIDPNQKITLDDDFRTMFRTPDTNRYGIENNDATVPLYYTLTVPFDITTEGLYSIEVRLTGETETVQLPVRVVRSLI